MYRIVRYGAARRPRAPDRPAGRGGFPHRMPDDAAIYAIYPHRRYLPAKVRAFVDYLAAWFKNHGSYCD